jgi:crotonobetainyl-CoA:carnitine CoA-transferase CaiB-like acyl-CoA transferase
VLDVGSMIAGPFGSSLLGDFGADVIKIERPGQGDPLRHWPPMRDGISLWWKVTNRNKRVVSLNIAKPRGRVLFQELARHADVVIENFRPGTLEKWDLGEDVLRAANERLVLVRVSGYGQTGPHRQRPGFGTIAEAISGLAWFTGPAEHPPTLPAFPLADTVAGCFAALGALTALAERDRVSGKGQVVDVSLYEPLFRLIESQAIAFDQLGIVKQRQGNRPEEDSPRNAFETSDGAWIAISAPSDRSFERLTQAMERADLLEDPRYRTNTTRIEHAEELDAEIARWVAQHTAAECVEMFDGSEVAAGQIYNIEDIFNDVQYQFRSTIAEVADDDFGSVKMPAVVPLFSRSQTKIWRTGARQGNDNAAVFGDGLGLTQAELDELEAAGVI